MKTYIKNRNSLKLAIEVEGSPESKKLVLVTHGLSGSKDQPHIIGMRQAFTESGYMVVSFDTAYSFGESEGDSINATASSYISDLEDVIAWAKHQEWYKEPFVLAGHSLGGITSLVYASRFPHKVSALFPMSTVVSGKLWRENQDPEHMRAWQEKGYFFKESSSMPGRSGKIGYGMAVDIVQHDALEFASEISCPTLLLVGAEDDGTTPEMHRLLYDKLVGPKELHIIDGMKHTPKSQEEIVIMKRVIKDWLGRLWQQTPSERLIKRITKGAS